MVKKAEISKRKNGEGSVYQRKDGLYSAAVSLGKDENGKRLRHVENGSTEQEAIEKMNLWLSKNGYLKEEKVVINGQTLVEDFIEDFKLRGLKDSGIADVTFSNYVGTLDFIADEFRGRRIGEIDLEEVNKFLVRMSRETVNGEYRFGQASIDRTLYLMRRMFRRAVNKKYLTQNPIPDREYKAPKANKINPEIKALTSDEVQDLLDVLKGHDTLYPVIVFMLNTGVRLQEALAVKWADIDFENNIVHIRRALTKKMEFDAHGEKTSSQTVVGRTKSKTGGRDIGVPDSLIDFLKKWRETAPEVSQTKTGDDDFVFGKAKSPSWTCEAFRSALNSYIKKHSTKLTKLGPHRLRHTVATMVSNQPGVTVFHIMQLLGHSDTRMAQKYVDRQREERTQKNQEVLGQISSGWNIQGWKS